MTAHKGVSPDQPVPERCQALLRDPLDSNDIRAWRNLAFELERAADAKLDESLDKIMAMSEEQITALAAYEGHNPDDQARLGNQAVQIATLRIALRELYDACVAVNEAQGRQVIDRHAMNTADKELQRWPRTT